MAGNLWAFHKSVFPKRHRDSGFQRAFMCQENRKPASILQMKIDDQHKHLQTSNASLETTKVKLVKLELAPGAIAKTVRGPTGACQRKENMPRITLWRADTCKGEENATLAVRKSGGQSLLLPSSSAAGFLSLLDFPFVI